VDGFGTGEGKQSVEGVQTEEEEAGAMLSQQSTAACTFQEGFQEETCDVHVDTNINHGEGHQTHYEHDYADLTCPNSILEELQALKGGKTCGVDGIMAEMIVDGGDALHQYLLNMHNRMLEGVCTARLWVGLITAVFNAGDVNDMGNYRSYV